MGVKPLPHWELYECDLAPMPPIPPMLLVSEPHHHKAEQLLRAVLGDIGVCFCKPVQTIIVPHPFNLSAVFNQMTALLQDLEQMAPMHEVYLMLLAQMFITWMVSMEQYSLLRAHIHGSELLTQSEAAAAIFLQSTGGNVSDEEAMSCEDETPVMPPAPPRLSSSRQTLWGAALHQLMLQQPSPTLPTSLTPQTSRTPAPAGWTSMLERLFVEVPSQQGQTAVPMPCTRTHSTESHRGSTGSKWKVHPSGDASVEPPEKQQHHSCSDNTVFIMMDSSTTASSDPIAEDLPTPSLEKVAPSSSWGWPTCFRAS